MQLLHKWAWFDSPWNMICLQQGQGEHVKPYCNLALAACLPTRPSAMHCACMSLPAHCAKLPACNACRKVHKCICV